MPRPSVPGAPNTKITNTADLTSLAHPAGPSSRGSPADSTAATGDSLASATAVAPAGGAAASAAQAFPFWVDEVLWSQGRPAVELIECVLQQLGGHRAGGPPRGSTAPDSDPTPDADDDDDAGPSSSGRPGSGSSTGDPGGSSLNGSSRRPWSESQLGYCHMEAWVFLWTKSVYAIKAARSLRPGQLVSAVVGLNSLTMKKRMVQTLKQALGEQAWTIMPRSFALPEELPQWQQWLAQHGAAQDSGLWILKTGQDAGRGLRLLPTSRALLYAAKLASLPSRPRNQLKVAQTYLTKPLLIRGRKSHLRLWLLVTGHRPLRAYLHTCCLLLFSSQAYEPGRPLEAGTKPAAGHVTNYARNEDTWVWDMGRLAAELGHAVFEKLWGDMAAAAAATAAAALGSLLAAHDWLRPSVADYGFQVLGLDFLVDEAMTPWLLELNSAPSIMAVHSDAATRDMIAEQKSAMLADTLAMVAHRFLPQANREAGEQPPRQCSASANGRSCSGAMPWQEQLQLELAHRGGYQPLMPLFAALQARCTQPPPPQQQQQQQQQVGSNSIPWQEEDFALQELLKGQLQ